MSILDTYDPHSRPLFTPEHIYGKREKLADVCIVTFHHKVLEKVLAAYAPSVAARAFTANGPIPVYLLEAEGQRLLFYMSPIGAPAAGAILQEVRALTGAEKCIVFGSCGVLAPEKCAGKIIVPTESCRDEGLSYHYAPGAAYMEMKNSGVVAQYLRSCGVPFAAGRNWTTDAIYRETENNIARRKAEGCISVEMEAAGLQAVADYLGVELYTFFFGGDILGESWDMGDLGGERERCASMDCWIWRWGWRPPWHKRLRTHRSTKPLPAGGGFSCLRIQM